MRLEIAAVEEMVELEECMCMLDKLDKHEIITAGMVDREELAREIEREIKPQLDKPGSLNALGAYMLIMKIVEGN